MTSDNCQVPIVKKTEYQLIDIDNEVLTLMDPSSGEMEESCNMPTEGHLKDVKKGITEYHDEQKKEVLVTVQRFVEQ